MLELLKRLLRRKKSSSSPSPTLFTTTQIDGETWVTCRSTGTPIRPLYSFFTSHEEIR
jgi:hypothetical protein